MSAPSVLWSQAVSKAHRVLSCGWILSDDDAHELAELVLELEKHRKAQLCDACRVADATPRPEARS